MPNVSRFARLQLGLVACLFCLGFAATDTFGQSLTLSPDAGPGGITVIATASGFAQGQPTGLKPNTGFYVNGGFVGACPGTPGTDGWANCTISLTMPGGPPNTAITVSARNSFAEQAEATFSALDARIHLSRTCGPAGTTIAVSGVNYAFGYDAGIYLDGGLVINNNYPNPDGSFFHTITGPISAGPHTITVFNSVQDTDSKTFDVNTCAVIGKVTDIDGTAEVSHDGGQTFGPLSVGDPVSQNDVIKTGQKSATDVLFNDNTTYVFSQDSTVKLDEWVYDPNDVNKNNGHSFFQFLQGSFEYLSGLIGKDDPDAREVETPVGSLGFRGTQLIAILGPGERLEVDLIQGSLSLSPYETITTTVYTGPIKIVTDGEDTTTSELTQEAYNALRDELFPAPSSDSVPPQVTVTFAAPPTGQAGYFNGTQVPVSGSVSATDISNVTAISCLDSRNGLTTGSLTGGGTATAGETLGGNGDGVHAISCTATDGANNSGAAMGSANTASVSIDATAPTITFSGNAGSYRVDQTIAITCAASDALSGVNTAATTCPGASGPAYTFPLGTTTRNASAKDNAGNTSTKSTSFIVSVTYTSLMNLVRAFETKTDVANKMISSLQSANSAATAGDTKTAKNQINAFINQVQAQTGKSLTQAQAALLIQLASAL